MQRNNAQGNTTRRGALAAGAAAAAVPAERQAASATGAAFLAAPGEGRTHWMVGDRLTLRVPAGATGGAFSMMEIFVVPGGGPPPHTHARESETFHVLEGEVTFLAGIETVRAGPGTAVHVPAGVPHNFGNKGAAPARMLMVIAPAGFEDFFAEAGTPGRADDPTPAPVDEKVIARLQATAPKYGMTLLPPAAPAAGR